MHHVTKVRHFDGSASILQNVAVHPGNRICTQSVCFLVPAPMKKGRRERERDICKSLTAWDTRYTFRQNPTPTKPRLQVLSFPSSLELQADHQHSWLISTVNIRYNDIRYNDILIIAIFFPHDFFLDVN